jgi:hypothetical protein
MRNALVKVLVAGLIAAGTIYAGLSMSPSTQTPQKNSGPPTDADATNFVRSTQAHRGLQCPELRPQIVPWSSLCRADWV